MGPAEALLRQRYQQLCAELGDCYVRRKAAEARISVLEDEIASLNGSLSLAKEMDHRNTPSPQAAAPSEPRV